jgi:hypothetical protein
MGFLSILKSFGDSQELKDFGQVTRMKLEVARRNASFNISDKLKKLCFRESDSEGYIEYLDGFKIKNLTSGIIEEEGLSVFKIKVEKDINIDIHDHKSQSQTILVKKGRLLVLDDNIEIFPSESFFIKKKKPHNIKYMAGTEAIVIYLPNLNRYK